MRFHIYHDEDGKHECTVTKSGDGSGICRSKSPIKYVKLDNRTLFNTKQIRYHPHRGGLTFIQEWDNNEGEFDLYERSCYRGHRGNHGVLYKEERTSHLMVFNASYK